MKLKVIKGNHFAATVIKGKKIPIVSNIPVLLSEKRQTHTKIQAHKHTCMHAPTPSNKSTDTFAHTHTQHTCTLSKIYPPVNIHTHTHTHIYTYTHTHTHTHTHNYLTERLIEQMRINY